jgi:hypothetical protein
MNKNIIKLFGTMCILLTACTPVKSPKVKLEMNHSSLNSQDLVINKKVDAPTWIDSGMLLGDTIVVGFSKPVFQGAYMQQQNAMNDARIKLSHKIKSVISAKNTQKFIVYSQEISTKYVKNIEAFNNLILNDIQQYDAYLDKAGNLYILAGIGPLKRRGLVQRKRDLDIYKQDELLYSHCYKKEQLLKIQTKAPLYKGRPLWFYIPQKEGYYTSIGIAQKNGNNYEKQRTMAVLLGKSNLMKKIRSQSSSKLQLLEVMRDDESATLYDVWGHNTSSAKVSSIRVEDFWMDPKTCELYAFVYSKR